MLKKVYNQASVDLYPPAPFSAGERGEETAQNKQVSKVPLREERDLGRG